MSKTALSNDTLKKIAAIKQADLVIGVPSFRNAGTIKHVVETACSGANKYFPYLKTVFVNSDGGSTDNTRQVVLDTKVPACIEKIVTPYKGIPGKGSAFRTIFEIADRLHAKVIIVLDSDLRSVTPEWIKYFGEPIIKNNYGYVVPHYRRHKYDGTITNSIAYPLTRSLYGLNIRQPIAGDFGITGALNKYYSHQDIYDDGEVAKFGIDIFMTTTAICEGFKIAQTHAGAKIHEAKDPAADLTPMFSQVVSTLFTMMDRYELKWRASTVVEDVWAFGDHKPLKVPAVSINFDALIQKFLDGYSEHKQVIDAALERSNGVAFKKVHAELAASRHGPGAREREHRAREILESSYFNWPRTVFDMAVSYNLGVQIGGASASGAAGKAAGRSVGKTAGKVVAGSLQEKNDLISGIGKKKIIEALIPLYYLKVARFYEKTKTYSYLDAEREILLEAREFEFEKYYLLNRWDKQRAKKGKK